MGLLSLPSSEEQSSRNQATEDWILKFMLHPLPQGVPGPAKGFTTENRPLYYCQPRAETFIKDSPTCRQSIRATPAPPWRVGTQSRPRHCSCSCQTDTFCPKIPSTGHTATKLKTSEETHLKTNTCKRRECDDVRVEVSAPNLTKQPYARWEGRVYSRISPHSPSSLLNTSRESWSIIPLLQAFTVSTHLILQPIHKWPWAGKWGAMENQQQGPCLTSVTIQWWRLMKEKEIKFQVVISSYERKQGIKQHNPLRERRVMAGFSDGVTFKLTYEGWCGVSLKNSQRM